MKSEFIKSGTRPAHYPDLGLPEVAFAGRSNVGKSSLMNTLMQRKKLVKVSSTPGRTQLLSWFTVDDSICLCDLPGYGFAKVPGSVRAGWGKMVGDYLAQRDTLLALTIITDVRRGFEDEDLSLLRTAAELGIQPVLVATKCDKLKRNALMTQSRRMCAEIGADPKDVIWFSSHTGAGRDKLWQRLRGLTSVEE